MKVHLIRKETIEDFCRQNAQSRTSFTEWLTKLKFTDWEEPADMQRTFPSTDLLENSSNEEQRRLFLEPAKRHDFSSAYAQTGNSSFISIFIAF